jgi:hypothetical protein
MRASRMVWIMLTGDRDAIVVSSIVSVLYFCPTPLGLALRSLLVFLFFYFFLIALFCRCRVGKFFELPPRMAPIYSTLPSSCRPAMAVHVSLAGLKKKRG